MANVIFKRGAQANLPATGDDGIFYLTTDTNRLYVGQGSGKAPQLLNQTVNVVEALANLPTNSAKYPNVAVNDFYYCKAENILAVCTEVNAKDIEWTQINPDTNTFIDEAKFEGGVNTEGTAIEYTLTLGYNEETKDPITASFSLDSTLLGTIVPSEVAVGLTQETYIKPGYGSAGVTIKTTGSGANTQYPINFTNGANISITNQAEKEIVISHATFTAQKTEASDATSLGFGDEFVVTEDVAVGSNGHVTSIVEKKYKLPLLPSIPSQEEIEDIIEDKLLGLDPMRYKGTVNTTTKLPTSNISVGDTYMVSEVGVYGEAEQLAVIGDLFIAVGAENSETGYIDGIVTWTHVPSGNETYTDNDTKYHIHTRGDGEIVLTNAANYEEVAGDVTFKSETLSISTTGPDEITVDLTWGTF